jgi:hypothetical protein
MSTRRLALAGVVAPPLFAAIVLLLTVLAWDELHDLGWSAGLFDDPDAAWPSVAMLADRGILQSLNYAVLGLATMGLAVALRRLGARLVESTLVGLLGLGFAISAFRIDRGSTTGGGPETWNGTLHALGLTIVVLAALGAMVAFAALRRDRLSIAALVAALACIAVAVAGSSNVFAVFLAVVLAWLTLVAWRCLELSRPDSEPASAAPAARPAT